MDPTLVRWRGVLAMLNQRTGDGRMIRSLRWPDLPVPLRWVREDTGAHDGAILVGQIDDVETVADEVVGRGFLDSSTPEGAELLDRLQTHGSLGVSLDLDDTDFEVWSKAAKVEAEATMLDTLWDGDADSDEVTQAVDDYNEIVGIGREETSEEGERYVVTARQESDDQLFVFTDALVRAATIVDVPAFIQGQIELDTAADESTEPPVHEGWRNALTASLPPLAPPREWFDDPHLTGPTPMVVDDDGRVYGHAGLWGTCYAGSPAGVCTEIPHDDTGYARFRAGYVRCSDGSEVAVGPITMGDDHAPLRMTAAEAQRHYSATSMAVADVVVGEDAWGVWVAGALRPDVTPEQIRTLRASPLSGDWREQWGPRGWEISMVAAHAVNNPGFLVPRVSGSTRNGRTYALVASLGPAPSMRPQPRLALTADQVAALGRLADRQIHDEQAHRSAVAAALAAQVDRDAAKSLVRRVAEQIGVV